MNNNNFDNIIKEKTEEYYNSNKKNRIFKNKQKSEIAKEISNSININQYLKTVIYPDNDNPNHLFFSYEKLKPVNHPDNYKLFLNYIDQLLISILNTHDKYYFHVDIFSLTMSGLQRIKPLIDLFATTEFNHGKYNSRGEGMEKIYIYNSPKMINNMRSIVEPMIFSIIDLEKVIYLQQK